MMRHFFFGAALVLVCAASSGASAQLPTTRAGLPGPSSGGGGGWSLIAHTGIDGAGSGVTTSAINTTGANLLVAVCNWYASSGSVSDSNGNIWTLGFATSGADTQVSIYYVYNPTVGSGHTFTWSAVNGPITVMAWSGSASSPADQSAGQNTTGATTVPPGSITPSQNNELVIAGVDANNNISSIDSGYTITDNESYTSGVSLGGAAAYLIQTTASATNPTFTLSGTNDSGAAIMSFK
jgi:hypothetical protein